MALSVSMIHKNYSVVTSQLLFFVLIDLFLYVVIIHIFTAWYKF
jgi:hypothetical protein